MIAHGRRLDKVECIGLILGLYIDPLYIVAIEINNK